MDLPQRKKNRLQGYDYSTPGAYFITICTHNRTPFFGSITSGDSFRIPEICLSEIGRIVYKEILEIESHYTNVKVEKYTIMPNHIHMIVVITERINPFPTAYDIPNVVGKFKAAVTRNVGKAFMPSSDIRIWQTSFYDHVIRTEQDYREIWQYMDNNPAAWAQDRFYRE